MRTEAEAEVDEDDEELAEQMLVRRARHGDSTAFDRLVLRHQARLRSFVARYVRETADVFDLVQEVFIRAWRNLHRLEPDRPFARWLTGIARHVVADHLRQRYGSCEARTLRLDHRMLELLGDRSADEHRRLDEERRAAAALRSCLGKLPGAKRKLIRWRFEEGLSVRSIARNLTKKETAISMALARLRQDLQDCVRRRLRGGPA